MLTFCEPWYVLAAVRKHVGQIHPIKSTHSPFHPNHFIALNYPFHPIIQAHSIQPIRLVHSNRWMEKMQRGKNIHWRKEIHIFCRSGWTNIFLVVENFKQINHLICWLYSSVFLSRLSSLNIFLQLNSSDHRAVFSGGDSQSCRLYRSSRWPHSSCTLDKSGSLHWCHTPSCRT